MKERRIFYLLHILVYFFPNCVSFPVGINLSPLGGNFLSIDWNSISTYVFIDLFKHCGPFYVRSTFDGGSHFHWQSKTDLNWRHDGYPDGLPYSTVNEFSVSVCDIGAGGKHVRNGTYVIMWEGDGLVSVAEPNANVLSLNLTDKTSMVQFRLKTNTGINVRIMRSSTTDPVRNIRLVPVEYSENYTSQIFQPEFLETLKPFDHLRFTGWQKISQTPKIWTDRTTVSSQTQHGDDGVAIEHMIDLILVLNTSITSVWFSFPLESMEYNSHMIQFLHDHLPKGLTIYYESGSPESHGDSDRHTEALLLYSLFDTVFQHSSFTLMPAASVVVSAYIPHLVSWYGEDINRVKAVAVPSQFGRSDFSWDVYDDHGEWSLAAANFSSVQLLKEFRKSVLVVEVMLNRYRKVLMTSNPSIQLVGFGGGPYFKAASYGYRAGEYSAQLCASANQFPCTWYNTQYFFANSSEYEKALPSIRYNASLEQVLEDKLISLHRNQAITDMYLDLLRRWTLIEGDLFTGAWLVKPVMTCRTGGDNCGNNGMFESPEFENRMTNSKYAPLLLYKDGIIGTLPFTSEDITTPPESICESDCQWGTCFNGTCICYAGYSGVSCNILTPKPNDCTNDTGINLAGISDWSTEWPFVDLFHTSRPWIAQDFVGSAWDTQTSQHLRSDGYPEYLLPTQRLGSMMMRDLQNHMRKGVFICLYDGDGIITFSMDIIKVVRDVGRIEVTVHPSTGLNNGVFLVIERTNPLDPIRNIRFIMPNFESTYTHFPFHPLFLHTLRSYKTLRFMDWANTNAVQYGSWSDRSTSNTTRTYTTGTTQYEQLTGVSIEHMILLSNTLGTSPWFCMPHKCTDDFVRRFAQLVKDTLRPDVKIYVEYSNEVWGSLFPGGIYAQEKGLMMGLSTNAAYARLCYYGIRSREIFTIWKQIFGNDSDRLELVLSSQSVNSDVSRVILQCGGHFKNATALAIAPYFGEYNFETDLDLNVFMNTTLPNQIDAWSNTIQEHSDWAKAFNLSLITYESGQGLHGSGLPSDLSIQANRDIRMRGLYRQYFSMLRENGVSLMMQFSSAGLFNYEMCWGLIEATDSDPSESPKFLGLQDYIDLYSTCEMIDKHSCPMNCSDAGYCTSTGNCECYYGYSGDSCEIIEYTEHTDLCGYKCSFDQGVCVPDYVSGRDRYWKCDCHSPYFGVKCDLFNCTSACHYNGRCIDADVCSCYPGYSGQFCEIDCGCNGHGHCASSLDECVCDVGYQWSEYNHTCVADCDGRVCAAPGHAQCESCKYGSCVDGTCVCWAGYSGDQCDESRPRSNSKSKIGTNLGGISYWTTEWAFVDVMKMSSDWISGYTPGLYHDNPWDNGMPIALRPDGYPAYLTSGQIVGKLMLRDVRLHAPSGVYVCLYEGDGVINFGFDSKILSIGKGRIEFQFTPTTVPGCTQSYCNDNGIYLVLLETNPANPVRNIRILMPGFEHRHKQMPFHPWFLKNLEYYSVIRYMSWQGINGNDLEITWADRTHPSAASYSRSVPIEYMVHLSNVLGADAWFCMPHRADDNYIRNFAIMVKETLRSDLKIYIEYSNEVWNLLFSQSSYAQTRGLELGLSEDNYIAQYRFYSQRSVEIFNIWKEVFGSSSTRLVTVLSTFTISPSVTTTILTWRDAYKVADMLAIAPYFDCGNLGSSENAGQTALMSVEEVLVECSAHMSSVEDYITPMVEIAAAYNLSIGTYEAGQSLVEMNVMQYGTRETAGLTELFLSVNRNSGFKAVYKKYIETLDSSGLMSSHPMMHFVSGASWSRYGSWGAIEFTGQPYSMTFKYQALLEYIKANSDDSISLNSNCLASGANIYGLGLASTSFYGFPAVISPRFGDIWVIGEMQSVKWDTHVNDHFNISLFLHQVSDCNTETLDRFVTTIATNITNTNGVYFFQLDHSMVNDFTGSYYVEIRGLHNSNFSEIFTLSTPTFLIEKVSHCCNGIEVLSGTCVQALFPKYSNPLYNSNWKYSASANECLNDLQHWQIASCQVDSSGCRNFRTAGNGKPVTDCVAQTTAFPQKENFSWGLATRVLQSDDDFCVELFVTTSSCTPSLVEDLYCTKQPTTKPTTKPTSLPIAQPSSRPSQLPLSSSKRPILLVSRSPSFGPHRRTKRRPSTGRPISPQYQTKNPVLLRSRSPSFGPYRRTKRPPSPTLGCSSHVPVSQSIHTLAVSPQLKNNKKK